MPLRKWSFALGRLSDISVLDLQEFDVLASELQKSSGDFEHSAHSFGS